MMESSSLVRVVSVALSFLAMAGAFLLLFSWYILPSLVYKKLKSNGFSGPKPSFPFGNLKEMRREMSKDSTIFSSPSSSSSGMILSNDIHSTVFAYFAKWQKLHGKVFVYWMGTQPFLYIAEPKFLKQMCADIRGKDWGKPNVFKHDREHMFGNGLIMVEAEDWIRRRRIITPAFSPSNLKAMASLMADSTRRMLDRWAIRINSGYPEIDVEREIICTAGEIIAETSFGINSENGAKVMEKLREIQAILFKSNRHVGVPYGKFLNPKQTLKSKKLGKEVNSLLLSLIAERRGKLRVGQPEQDLLGMLMTANCSGEGCGRKRALTTTELVDECKTFFFGGHETTALALTWTLLMLAVHTDWQNQLREEIGEVLGSEPSDAKIIQAAPMLAALKKMDWVMNEVLRLYPPAPNVQRQSRQKIQVGELVIPNGMNIWIDVVSMHHDKYVWGENANEFNPERFKDDIFGGSNEKMGFLPFGFGGRMCIGRNLSNLEYKIVLTLILSTFSFSLSPNYTHFPSTMLSLRPINGLPIIFKPLKIN